MYLFHQKQFIDLYELYFTRMVRFSQVYVGNEQDAENLVQDVFLYLWEHQEALSKIENMDAFLFVLIKNRCLNFLKRQSFLLYVNDERAISCKLNIDALGQFEEIFGSVSEIEEVIRKAIAQLPNRCREIFILSKIEKMKYKEIAEKLDISVNTVENQMSIALKKLRNELKEYLPLFFFLCS